MECRRHRTGPDSDEIPRRRRRTGLVRDNQADLKLRNWSARERSRAVNHDSVRSFTSPIPGPSRGSDDCSRIHDNHHSGLEITHQHPPFRVPLLQRSSLLPSRTQLLKSGVAVERPPLLKKLSRSKDRKCPPKSRTSFIGHPSAMKFLRTSRV
jgi:hypothetical protein